MKSLKVLSGIVAAAMTAVAMGVTMVASAADSVAVTIGKETAEVGGTFSVDVDLSTVPGNGLTSIDFGINYDSSIIEITDVTLGAAGNTGAGAKEDAATNGMGDTIFTTNDTGDQLVVIWSTGLTDSTYWAKKGTLLTISGKVKSTAKNGDVCKLEGVAVDRAAYPGGGANPEAVFSAVGESATVDYTAAFTNGSITVGGASSTIVWGDANCNGELELADAVMLAKASAGIDGVTLSTAGRANCDVYADNNINGSDLSIVLGLIAGSKEAKDMPEKP